ncbi:three-Cys-motif partner protein TcmP [Hyphomicrobium zavarzinii]|uniref:three-Cys-motif partner protein TcmP n=1 Tax=Hyphomicrobium zavarzinii TaxID=48292 RepID=UPI0003756898|nr:three-Cys-motif partner protein TcmP [Hyphomicrobium zavarzinii]
MVAKSYDWENGVALEDHTRRKHKILREYFSRYLSVRCVFPQQTKFRLAIIDAFAGGGRYLCGAAGSPLIFIEELRLAAESFNVRRKSDGMAPIDIECFLILNDVESGTIAILRSHVEPLLAAIRAEVPQLHIQVVYHEEAFESLFPNVKADLKQGRYQNVLFNLDQYAHSDVKLATLRDISVAFASAEIFYTFSISSLLAFLHKSDSAALSKQLAFLSAGADLSALEQQMSRTEWLGAAERLVFDRFRDCAQFVSPFSINNPDGWRYWLIHMANNYRARQEYNNVLHQNSSMQAHFGRSGLNMLSFDPSHEGALYLFDVSGRVLAKQQLLEDIPRVVTDFGDAISVGQFYGSIYNMTPNHTDDIHAAIVENADLEVLTETGGVRRSPNTIRANDTLRIKRQRTFFPIFLGSK